MINKQQPIRKQILYRGLREIPIYIEDKSETSDNYFVISDFPKEFTAGKNYFYLSANINNLELNSEILIEILDANNNPIYYEVSTEVDRAFRRLITVFVYPETTRGIATVNILGTAKTLHNQSINNEWKKKINVRWTKQISVDPLKRNISKLIFNEQPIISVSESFGTYQQYVSGSYTSTSSIFDYKTSFSYSYPLSSIQSALNYETIVKQDNQTLNFGYSENNAQYNTNTDNINTQRQLTSRLDNIYSYGGFSYNSDTYPILRLQNTSSFSFTPEMQGGKVTIYGPRQLTPATSSDIIFANATEATYSADIVNVLNSSTIQLSNPYYRTVERKNRYSIVKIEEKKHFSSFYGQDNITIAWNPADTFTQSAAYQTLLRFDIANLNPSSGTVKRIKAYAKNPNSLEEYQLLTDKEVQPVNMLIGSDTDNYFDYGNTKTLLEAAARYYIKTVDTGASRVGTGSLLENTYISYGFHVDSNPNYYIYSRKNVSYYENTDYVISMNLYATTTGSIDIFMSGSAFNPDNNITGKKIASINSNKSRTVYRDLSFRFTADNDGTGVYALVLKSGYWYVSNIRIYPLYESGFNPKYFKMEVPIKAIWNNSNLDLKLEYYDGNNSLCDSVSYIKNVLVKSGSAHFIQGGYNVLTGSMYLGSDIGRGMVLGVTGKGTYSTTNPNWQGSKSVTDVSYNGMFSYSGSMQGGTFGTEYNNSSGGLHIIAYQGPANEEIGQYSGSLKVSFGPTASFKIVANDFYFGDHTGSFLRFSGSSNYHVITASKIFIDNDGTLSVKNPMVSGSLIVTGSVIAEDYVDAFISSSYTYVSSSILDTINLYSLTGKQKTIQFKYSSSYISEFTASFNGVVEKYNILRDASGNVISWEKTLTF